MVAPDAWRYNEDADIKLLCLRLFAVQQRARLLSQDLACRQVRLVQLLPCVEDTAVVATAEAEKAAAATAKVVAAAATAEADTGAKAMAAASADAESLSVLVVKLASSHVVRATVLPTVLTAVTLLELLAKKPSLPFAAINKDKAAYADSILLLELDGPAPRACCPANVAVGERTTRTYKTIAPAHHNLLAVLLQSKHHRVPDSAGAEVFRDEYAKCIDTPIPFIFVLISDAPNVTHNQWLSWPYNGNGYFVGRDQLQQFYGEFLYHIRAEAWVAK